jgi:hypothetical protein
LEGIVAQACNPSTGEARHEDLEFTASQGYILRPCLKKKKKRAGEMAQLVECLPIKCEALSSNIPTMKERKETCGIFVNLGLV